MLSKCLYVFEDNLYTIKLELKVFITYVYEYLT